MEMKDKPITVHFGMPNQPTGRSYKRITFVNGNTYDALVRLVNLLSDGFVISHIDQGSPEELPARTYTTPTLVSLDDIENELIKRFKQRIKEFIG